LGGLFCIICVGLGFVGRHVGGEIGLRVAGVGVRFGLLLLLGAVVEAHAPLSLLSHL
jgi:hypothetical protein